jgi:hypothetical protein
MAKISPIEVPIDISPIVSAFRRTAEAYRTLAAVYEQMAINLETPESLEQVAIINSVEEEEPSG